MTSPDSPPTPDDYDRTTSIGGNTRTELDVTSDLNDPSRPPADGGFAPPVSISDGSNAGRGGRPAMQLGQYALLGSPDGKSVNPVHGGEGCVYLAQRLDGGPRVALKTPLPKYADRAQRCARLIKEAKHLRSMDHPSIVKVFDIVEDHQPPFYTMTCLPNGSLAERLEDGKPMPHDEVLRLSVPLADAVKYVHEIKGVSHRDIKPQNVMMDANDQPVFVDFGLSRDNTGDQASIVDPESDASASRFKVGTLLYMAPELFEGKAGNSQTDIYAFGVMLYVMATGQRPYDGRDFDTLSVQKRLADPLEPLAAHPELDPRLAQVIAHATARRAKDRYATMEDLHEDLCAVRGGKPPVHAALPSQATAGDAQKTRSGGLAKLAAAAVLLIAAGGGGYYYFDQINNNPSESAAQNGAHGSLFDFAENTDAPPQVSATPPNQDPQTANPDTPQALSGPTHEAGPGISEPSATIDSEPGSAVAEATTTVELEGTPAEDVTTYATPDPPTDEVTSGPTAVASRGDTPKETQAPAVEPPPMSLFTDEVELVNQLVQDFSARLSRDPALDTKAVAALDELLRVTQDQSRLPLRDDYQAWIHDAAKFGATDSLAWLIQNAPEFDVSSNVETDAGYHWLQSAIESPENRAFAASLTAWMKTHEIDPSILTAHAIGTDSPLTLAQDLGRDEWIAALRAAAQEYGIDLKD